MSSDENPLSFPYDFHDDALFHILEWLDFASLLSFSHASLRLSRRLARGHWALLCKKHFPTDLPCPEDPESPLPGAFNPYHTYLFHYFLKKWSPSQMPIPPSETSSLSFGMVLEGLVSGQEEYPFEGEDLIDLYPDLGSLEFIFTTILKMWSRKVSLGDQEPAKKLTKLLNYFVSSAQTELKASPLHSFPLLFQSLFSDLHPDPEVLPFIHLPPKAPYTIPDVFPTSGPLLVVPIHLLTSHLDLSVQPHEAIPLLKELMGLPPLHVAQCFTMIELCHLVEIEPCAFLIWITKSIGSLDAVVSFSENVSCIPSLVLHLNQKDAVGFVEFLIEVSEHLLSLNNFSTCKMIISGLGVSHVQKHLQTQQILQKISVKAMETLGSIQNVLHIDNSYKTLRDRLAEVQGPFVPYLGIIFKDIRNLRNHDEATRVDGRVRVIKCRRMVASLSAFKKCKSQVYTNFEGISRRTIEWILKIVQIAPRHKEIEESTVCSLQ